jgi:outer membrane biogenesis lipoprotein LolB
MRLDFILIILSTFLFACSQNSENGKNQDPLWELEQQVFENGENIEIDEINKAIEKASTMRLSWAYSPITIAIRVAGQQMVSPQVKVLAKSMSGNELITHTVVMIEKQNLQDDSIDDQYYRIELKLGGSIWQVMDIKKAWNCKANRGHSEVNAEVCK